MQQAALVSQTVQQATLDSILYGAASPHGQIEGRVAPAESSIYSNSVNTKLAGKLKREVMALGAVNMVSQKVP